MRRPGDLWSAWFGLWAAAVENTLALQARFMQNLLPKPRAPAPEAREPTQSATAGDKPAAETGAEDDPKPAPSRRRLRKKSENSRRRKRD